MKHHAEVRRTKAQSLKEQKVKANPMHGTNMLASYVQGAKKHDRSGNLGTFLHPPKKKR